MILWAGNWEKYLFKKKKKKSIYKSLVEPKLTRIPGTQDPKCSLGELLNFPEPSLASQ